METNNSILPPMWEVPQVFRDRLGDKVGRQRAMFADDHLLLVLHDPPAADEIERVGRFYWRQPNGQWTSTQQAGGSGAIMSHLDEYSEQIDEVEKQDDSAQ